MLLTKSKSDNQLGKHVVLICCHDAIGATNCVGFGAAFWLVVITNSGGGHAQIKGLCEEDPTLMEVKVLVR